mmetsp:Transcript_9706/g.14539  ORF Transcript_9706/g.14539 Transcript_9706/m.14539 type:complete len:246 (+) Transcript_9706:91-828(+)
MLYDGENGRSFEPDSIELKVSKRAFDCPEVEFWQGSPELSITTNAPTLENIGRGQPIKKRKIAKQSTKNTTRRENECPKFVAAVEWRMIRNEINKDLKVGEWAFDCTTLDMWWSKEIFEIFNMDLRYAKPSFKTYKKMLHPDDKDLVLFLFQRAIEKGVSYEVSHRFTLLDDSIKWCRVKCRVQMDPSHNGVTKLFGTIQDITLWSKSVIDGRKNMNTFVQQDQKEQKSNEQQGGITEDPTCAIS